METKNQSLAALMSDVNIKERFTQLLGAKANGFMSSVLAAQRNSALLQKADPKSIINAAAVAASLDLPIDANLGFAAIVPYNSKDGVQAQFQIMYKGFIQLAQRSGAYQTINVCEIYEGEIEKYNRVTGEFIFNDSLKKSDNIIGYAAFFKLLNGFEKTLYMPYEAAKKHGLRFSQSFKKGYGLWNDDFDAMAQKTVLKRLLSKYGILSIDMQSAVKFDQSIIKNENLTEIEYCDNIEVEEPKQLEVEKRVEKHIENSKTIAQLEQVKGEVNTESLSTLFNSKRDEIQSKSTI